MSSGTSTSISQSGASTPLNINATSLSTTISPSLPATISQTQVPTPTAVNNATNGTATMHSHPLPLTPHITPALSIVGVILIISGSAYVLIGIKDRLIQIFLSSAYLTSLSITVLIIYVMSPPVSNAVQGAYFVAAFMTGMLFGAGSLIFPEITEGLGCLLGGVCLSMWLLVLKPGGTITGTVGKIVFVLAFGVAVWSLSFTQRTRAYALIGATSFSGATAVVLGIDCFSRAGLKEFWLYIWALNDNIFPLNTRTYPITRGMQVEIAAVVLLCILGVISQLKLWRVIKDRREKKEAEQRDMERRKSAMEEAMGRFLEARTDREKAQWERIYGPQWDNIYNDHIQGSRSSTSEASTGVAQDNRKSWVGLREVPAGSAATAGVELNRLSFPRPDHNLTTRSKRQSAITVDTIPEDDETQAENGASTTDVHSAVSADGGPIHQSTSSPHSSHTVPSIPPLPSVTLNSESIDAANSNLSVSDQAHTANLQLADRRQSNTSILKRLSGQSGISSAASRSEEALIVTEDHHSRPSSIAATLNDELGELDLQSIHSEADDVSDGHNRGLMQGASSSTMPESGKRASNLVDEPPSPAALSIEFDSEELARPIMAISEQSLKPVMGSNVSAGSKRNSARTNDSDTSKGLIATSSNTRGSTSSPADTPSTESLTTGALVRVPSQLSDVVTTYRTNEWAKHISIAEVPIVDQTDAILGETLAESPVQLVEAPAPVRVEQLGQAATIAGAAINRPAHSTSVKAPVRHDKRHSTVTHPPESHVLATLDDKKDTASSHRLSSNQSPTTTPTIAIHRPASAGKERVALPLRLTRSSSTLLVNQTSPSTINENVVTQFASTSPPLSPPSTSPTPSASVVWASQPEKTPSGPQLLRSASYQGLPMRNQPDQIYQQAVAATSDTRLSYLRDSRQPQRQASTFVPGKRESMLADWQGSLQRESSITAVPQATLNQRRAEMMVERRKSQQSKQRQEVTQQYREKAVEQAMRTGDMQALHMQAMRKLQAKANKHVGS